MPATTTIAELERLAAVFGFTAEQLADNQAGRVAVGQLGDSITEALVGGLFFVAGLWAVLGTHRFRSRGGRVAGAGAAVAVLLIAIFVVAPAARDLFARSVVRFDGRIDQVSSVGKGRGNAVLVAGGLRITTDAEPSAAHALVEGRPYTVYYLRYSERLLSLEPLAGAVPAPPR